MTRAIGWIVALLAVAGALVFYNFMHLPMARRMEEQAGENLMWTDEVQRLRARLDELEALPDTAFHAVFTYDELFVDSESFDLAEPGEASLRGIIPRLQELQGTIDIIGHTDNTEVPKTLQEWLPTNWEYGAARAAAVARALTGWGIAPARIRVTSAADARPRADNTTPEGRDRNRRVEIRILR